MRPTTIKIHQLKSEWKNKIYNIAQKYNIRKDDQFLSLLTFDITLSLFCDEPYLDIVVFEEILAQNDPEYLPDKCKWKDKNEISMSEYIKQKFGENYRDFVKELLNLTKK
jgi:protein associated with RNAse G/E